MGDWSTSGRVNSCKVSPKVGCLPWDKRTNLACLAWKKADIFKIKGDGDYYYLLLLWIATKANAVSKKVQITQKAESEIVKEGREGN